MYHSVFDLSDDCLLNSLNLQSNRHPLFNTWNTDIFVLPFCIRQKSKFSIQYVGPRIWNTIWNTFTTHTHLSKMN